VGPEDLNELTRARPFVPFRIHMTGGTTYDILNPEFISVGRRIATIFRRPDPSAPFFETGLWIALVHIVRIETINEAIPEPAPTDNPQPK
jgi:hypothetical protein